MISEAYQCASTQGYRIVVCGDAEVSQEGRCAGESCEESDDNNSSIFGIRYVDLAGSMFDLGLAELAGFRFLHVLFID